MGLGRSSKTKMCNEANGETLWSSTMPYVSRSSVVTILNRISQIFCELCSHCPEGCCGGSFRLGAA